MLDIYHINGEDVAILTQTSLGFEVLKAIGDLLMMKRLANPDGHILPLAYDEIKEVTKVRPLKLYQIMSQLVELNLVEYSYEANKETVITLVTITDFGRKVVKEIKEGKEVRIPCPRSPLDGLKL